MALNGCAKKEARLFSIKLFTGLIYRLVMKEIPKTMKELSLFFITSPGPLTTALCLVFSLLMQVYLGLSLTLLLIIIALLFLRSIGEWVFHKHVWHVEKFKIKSLVVRNPIAEMHINHHKNPHDIDGVNFGFLAVIMAMACSFFIGYAFSLRLAFVFTTLSAASLLLYEWVHLLSHSAVTPSSTFLRELIARHRYHHYIDSQKCFGVSQVWADKLLGTDMPLKRK